MAVCGCGHLFYLTEYGCLFLTALVLDVLVDECYMVKYVFVPTIVPR